MSLSSAQHLLDEFNNGNWDEVGAYFDEDFQSFYNYLEKYGLGKKIDISQIDGNFLNMIVFARLQNNPKETLDFICSSFITDVYPMKEGYYLYLSSRDELAKLFSKSGRNFSARDVAERVLGEDSMEAFDYTTDDVYRDVIEVLNDKNTKYLADYILKEIGNQDLNVENYGSDFFHELAKEQNREDYFQITSNDVFDLINNEEAMNELLEGDLDDLRSNLGSIHWNAYNNAYESEVYNSVWSELETYFIKEFEHQTKETSRGKKTFEYIKIRDFNGVIYNYLSNNQFPNYSSEMIDYVSDYAGFLFERMYDGELEFLDFRIPDYPDHYLVDEYVNDYFYDYI